MSALAIRAADGSLWWYDITRLCVRCRIRVAHLSNTDCSKRRCSKCNLVSKMQRGKS